MSAHAATNIAHKMKRQSAHPSDVRAWITDNSPLLRPLIDIIMDYWRRPEFYANKHKNLILTLKDFLRVEDAWTSVWGSMMEFTRKLKATRAGYAVTHPDSRYAHRLYFVCEEGRVVLSYCAESPRSVEYRYRIGSATRMPAYFAERFEYEPEDGIFWVRPQPFFKEIYAAYRDRHRLSALSLHPAFNPPRKRPRREIYDSDDDYPDTSHWLFGSDGDGDGG